ncbi:MAG: hypothetical protein U0T81_09330 [Saprospiraceae bacterium]
MGVTIYFGFPESGRQIEISKAFAEAHELLGMCTILWCYLRNPSFKGRCRLSRCSRPYGPGKSFGCYDSG